MLVVGLTGGIGSGKTTVARCFTELGVPLIDADDIAHELVVPGAPALNEIVECFGPDALNSRGELDRLRLRHRVFTSPEQRRRLEAILHPRIRTEIINRIQRLDAPYCIVSIPLMAETGQADLVDRVLVIDCPPELQRQRIARRDGWSEDEITGAMQAQSSRAQRLQIADDVIVNDRDPEYLRGAVKSLHQKYLELSREAAP